MTIVSALSYGELAAMMPKAGGQYVHCVSRWGRSGVPLWMDAVPGDQTGTVAGRDLRQVLIFFPGCRRPVDLPVCTLRFLCGNNQPDCLGGMDVGLNTQNLAGIARHLPLTV
jgi:APA family basic amino acid/polyamine antiporter